MGSNEKKTKAPFGLGRFSAFLNASSSSSESSRSESPNRIKEEERVGEGAGEGSGNSSDDDDVSEYFDAPLIDISKWLLALAINTGGENDDEEGSAASIMKMVHPLMGAYPECFFDWISEAGNFSASTASTVATVLENKYKNYTERMMMKELKFAPMETISNYLTIAFCHLAQKDLPKAHARLDQVSRLLNSASIEGYIKPQHTEGFVYLFRGLEAHKQAITLGSLDHHYALEAAEKTLQSFLKQCIKYEKLSKISLATIYVAKGFFFGSNRVLDAQKSNIAKAYQADDSNVEICALYHFVSRMCRRETTRMVGAGDDEKELVLKLLEMDKNHPLTKLATCLYLTDVIKHRIWDFKDGPYVLGSGIKFATLNNLSQYIVDRADELLTTHPKSVKFNLFVADFYVSSLPVNFRDSDKAKECFRHALEINPQSSKANHKLGLLYLLNEDDPNEAILYFQRALAYDDRNFSALIDLLQLMMKEPHRFNEEIQAFLDAHINNPKWSPHRRANLLALRGFFFFMLKRRLSAVKSWVQAHKVNAESLMAMKNIVVQCRRYKWCRAAVEPIEIQDLLVHAMKPENMPRYELDEGDLPSLQAAHQCIVEGMYRRDKEDRERRERAIERREREVVRERREIERREREIEMRERRDREMAARGIAAMNPEDVLRGLAPRPGNFRFPRAPSTFNQGQGRGGGGGGQYFPSRGRGSVRRGVGWRN